MSRLVSSGHPSEAVLGSPHVERLMTDLRGSRSYLSVLIQYQLVWAEALSRVGVPTTSLSGYKAELLGQISSSRVALALSTWPTG